LAGTYDDGIFFATLNSSGVVTSARRWFWIHSGANGITPPMITASSNAGDYYISGSYAGIGTTQFSYVIKINASRSNEEAIDLKSLGLDGGSYYISSEMDGRKGEVQRLVLIR
jgi:hypothetical protein